MAKRPAFQFYAMDFLTDENVASMSNEEVGIYVKLLCHCWLQGSIPNDVAQLASMVGVSARRMDKLFSSTAFNKCWHDVESGRRLVNPRLQTEREKQDAWIEKSRDAGKRSGAARRLVEPTPNQPSTKARSKVGSPKVEPNTNSSSSSSFSVKEKRTETSSGTPTDADVFFDEDVVKRVLKPEQKVFWAPDGVPDKRTSLEHERLYILQLLDEGIEEEEITSAIVGFDLLRRAGKIAWPPAGEKVGGLKALKHGRDGFGGQILWDLCVNEARKHDRPALPRTSTTTRLTVETPNGKPR